MNTDQYIKDLNVSVGKVMVTYKRYHEQIQASGVLSASKIWGLKLARDMQDLTDVHNQETNRQVLEIADQEEEEKC